MYWNEENFSGTKIALLNGSNTVVYLRDDKPDIPFPAMWDLPGGGREHNEDPLQCGLREVAEEFGLSLNAENILLLEMHVSKLGGLDTCFCVMEISDAHVGQIQFGDEGQRWEMMPIDTFLNHPNAVPHLQERLKAFLIQQDETYAESKTKRAPEAP
jgi:8-oxo-dGTP diphosphatase